MAPLYSMLFESFAQTLAKNVKSVRYLSFIFYIFAVQSEEYRKIFLVPVVI